jgi:hypothetical protein
MLSKHGFTNLHEESIYLKGARDLLLRLQDDFDMYLVPCVKRKCKQSPYTPSEETYGWFPVTNTKSRKLIGEGLINALLSHRESLVRFLQGNYHELKIKGVERKKDKVVKIEIEVV